MKTQRITNVVIILLFLAVLFIPQIAFFFVKDFLPADDNEKRTLASRPSLKFNNIIEFPKKYDAYFDDNLPFRSIIKKMYNNFNYYILKLNSFNDVVIGKQTENRNMQWLFYNNKKSGDPLSYVTGIKKFSEKEKIRFVNNINKNTKKLEDKNIDLYYMVIPNKSTVYKELLPNNINIIQGENESNRLYNFIKANNINNYIYIYDELIDAKTYTYYSQDTHWNDYGGFIGARILQDKIDSSYNYLFDDVKIEVEDFYERIGDLTTLLNVDKINSYKEKKVNVKEYLKNKKYTVDKKEMYTVYTNEEPIVEKKIMIIGDSFNSALLPYLAKIYSEVIFIHIDDYNNDFIDKIKPDIVVIERVERYTNSLINFEI